VLLKRAEAMTALAASPEHACEHEEPRNRVSEAAHAAILGGPRRASRLSIRHAIAPSWDHEWRVRADRLHRSDRKRRETLLLWP
jgi:hypothetical protein